MTDKMPHPGPYGSEREALTAVGVFSPAGEYLGILGADGARVLLRGALAGAGVTLGAYDERIADWLAGWDSGPVAAVAGWITRAGQGGAAGAVLTGAQIATVAGALAYGAAHRREAAAWCTDCRRHPASLCADHEGSLDEAEAYDTLAALLPGGAR